MAPARPVGQDFFPLDEELGLLPGSLSPQFQDHLSRLAAWMPFDQAAEMLAALTGVQVSEATTRRQTYTAGAAYEGVQAAQVAAPEEPASPVRADKLVLSADGAMVPLVHGQWAEVKTLAIGEVPVGQEAGEVHCTHLSYFSRMSEATLFAEQATVETMRRGVVDAPQVCAVMDGAEWIDGLVDLHCPDAQRILDFPHAAGYVSEIGRLAGLVDPEQTSPWLATQLHTLKHEGPQAVLAELGTLCEHAPPDQEMHRHLAYLQKRSKRMQYPLYRAAGWPIGSGIVESGNKVVMQARLKGAGMHWAPSHVNPMLALRTAACNDRWDEAQQQLRTYQRAQRHLRRQHLVLQRARHQFSRTLQKRLAQRSQEPPPPLALPAISSSPTKKLASKYSWRQPFLRHPSSAKT
jgi:hypothetical protein